MGLFNKAVKTESKLRLAIAGPSGSGKTYTSLAVAVHLAQGGPIALVDTEHGSASKYADLFAFDVLEMTPPFHPDRFVKAITEAAGAGYKVLILDSISHAWNGTGGLLEVVDEIAKRMRTTNTFGAWKDATPIQNRFVDAIIAADLHIIATMRSKQDYVQEKDKDNRTVIRKVGMAPVQREGLEYEFDVFGDMNNDNEMIISKTRCPALTGRVLPKPGQDLAGMLLTWLHSDNYTPPAAEQSQPITISEGDRDIVVSTVTGHDTAAASDAEFAGIPNTTQERAEKAPHWIDDDDTRRRFWQFAKDNKLSETDTRAILGVESLHDYKGTKTQAHQALVAHLKAERVA